MPDPADLLLTYDQAAALVREQCALLPPGCMAADLVALMDASGRVLAEDVIADRDQPAFDRSTRDGFAARALDWDNGRELRVAGMLRAGEEWSGTLAEMQTVEIMTGAPLPSGADCVAMVEHVTRHSGNVILQAGRRMAAGDNVVRAGAEASYGSVIVPGGTRIGFRQIAAAAASGCPRLPVFKRPVVAILATGDELVDVAATPLSHQIRNSNGASLAAQVLLSGGVSRSAAVAGLNVAGLNVAGLSVDGSRIVADDRGSIDRALMEAMEADLILLSGGVSMGRYDFVEEVLTARGAEFFFTGVKMQPGKPVVFGRLPSAGGGWKYFFGLPGNPVSTMVTFALFAAPLLRALGGEHDATPTFTLATLSADMKAASGLTRFLPGEFSGSVSSTVVTPIAWQGSGDLAANARANCYIVMPADSPGLKAGHVVSILIT